MQGARTCRQVPWWFLNKSGRVTRHRKQNNNTRIRGERCSPFPDVPDVFELVDLYFLKPFFFWNGINTYKHHNDKVSIIGIVFLELFFHFQTRTNKIAKILGILASL